VKRTPIRKISKKKAAEKRIEADLRAKLLEEHEGLCQDCGRWPDVFGLSLHHSVFKSHGGKSTKENCRLICQACHEKHHNGGG
jgi:5-methylcytosine-specific restriction endonuclease McrA